MFTLIIPMKAVGKGRPRMSKKGHMYTPKETRDAEDRIRHLVKKGNVPLIEGPVFVDVRIEVLKGKKTGDYPLTKPDADNVIKLVLDAMNGVAYKDDAQVCSVTCEKFYSDRDSISITVGDYDQAI